jgi:hypothetical protein
VDVVWLRAANLARRGWRATVVLILFAGLAGGVAMATLAAGRRTSSAYDRMVRHVDPPELLLNFCPPEVTEVTEEALYACLVYEPHEERARIAELPEVEATAAGSYRGATLAPAGRPDDTTVASGLVFASPFTGGVDGRHLVVDGRWYDDDAPDEIVISERFRDRAGVGVGDEVELTFWSEEEIGAPGADGADFAGPRHHARVVGVTRGLLDLAASRSSIGEQEDLRFHAGPAFAAATREAAGFSAVLVDTAPGVTMQQARAAIERTFEGRLFQSSDALGDDELLPTREATQYEGRAAVALGILLAVAAAVFAGQAIARQARRDWSDGPSLRAIGVTRAEAGLAALARAALIAVPAALLAAGSAVALSPFGPIGVARRAEVDPGISLDLTVLALGSLGVVVAVLVCGWAPVVHRTTLSTRPAWTSTDRVRRRLAVPPTIAAGLDMGRRSGTRARGLPLGTAVTSVALAIGTLAAGVGLRASLDDLFDHPDRFGAPWDLSFGAATLGPDAATDALAMVRSSPDVAAAAGILGTDVELGDEVIAWVQAFEPIDGVGRTLQPPITSGRAPEVGEIALGTTTMGDLDLDLGDTVVVRTLTTREPSELVVVGTAIVNDNFEKSPGRGGIVPREWIEEVAPEVSADPYVLQLREGTDVDAFGNRLRERFGGIVSGPVPQEAIRNIDRIRALPLLLAAVVGALALASLGHALVTSVRRHRGQLAVLRALGFTGRQVRAAVAVHSTSLALGAAALGLPLGVILGRWGWRAVADSIGVAVVPVTPLVVLLAAVVATAILANGAAAYPARRAARISAAEALRTE